MLLVEDLAKKTQSLEQKLSKDLGRYNINDAKSTKTNFAIMEERINSVTTCATDRIEQRNVFSALLSELQHAEKDERAPLILLGALLHRYFRIIESESYDLDKTTLGSLVSRWGCFRLRKAEGSGLFLAIRKGLGLPEIVPNDTQWKETDLKILDVTTIVTALTCFRDHMMVLVDSAPRYMKYPHFQRDPEFMSRLNQIITTQEKRGSPILKQFKGVKFIQSVLDSLLKEKQKVSEALAKVVKDKKSFTNENVEQTLTAPEESNIKALITDLLECDYVVEKQGEMKWDDADAQNKLKKAIEDCYSSNAAYILIGAYLLLLQSLDTKKPEPTTLSLCIKQILSLDMDPGSIPLDKQYAAIKQFQEYSAENSATLNMDYWGSEQELNRFIVTKAQELLDKLPKKVDEAAATPSLVTASVA